MEIFVLRQIIPIMRIFSFFQVARTCLFWKNPKRDISPIRATKKTLELGIELWIRIVRFKRVATRHLRIRNKVNDQLFISSLRTEVRNTCCNSRFLGQMTMSMFFRRGMEIEMEKTRTDRIETFDRIVRYGRVAIPIEEEFNISVHLWDAGWKHGGPRDTRYDTVKLGSMEPSWRRCRECFGVSGWWIRDRWNVIRRDFELGEKCWRCREIESWE